MNAWLKRGLWLLQAMALLAALCLPSLAAGGETIRVAYSPAEGLLLEEGAGNYAGVAYEMMQETATYTGWDYAFVPGSRAESISRLEAGEVDLFLTLQREAEREAQYEYSALPLHTDRSVLVVRPDTDVWYQDLEHLRGCSVGALTDRTENRRLMAYLAENDCPVELHPIYETQQEMEQALADGREDAILLTADRVLSDCRVVLMLPETDRYIVARKGDRSVMDRLDNAMEQVRQNSPTLLDQLEERYHAYDNVSPSFTREEHDFLQELGSITVAMGPGDQEFLKTGDSGAESLLDCLSRLTGLTWSPQVTPDLAALYTGFQTGDYDLMLSMTSDYAWAAKHNAWITNGYFEYHYKMVRRYGGEEGSRVAVPRDSYVAELLERRGGEDVTLCASTRDALELVRNGGADVAYCVDFVADYYAAFPRYSALSFSSYYDLGTDNYCIGVSKAGDVRLVSVLNKALRCVPPELVRSTFSSQTTVYTTGLADMFYLHPAPSAILTVLVLVVLIGAVVLLHDGARERRRNRALEQAMQAKSDFLSRMSHDMRTPMNAILGLADLAEKEEGNPPVTQEYLDHIVSASRFLLGLINDVLDVSRMENGRIELHPEPFTLEQFINDINTVIRPLMDAKHIDFRFEMGCGATCILVDPLRYDQIFFNLLSNAAKFAPVGGRVELVAEHLGERDGKSGIRSYVRDNGVGMEEEFLPHLFEPFTQEKSGSTNQTQGSGLGMYIVKTIVEAMGGTISVRSQPGVGTEFVLDLWVEVVPHPQPEEDPVQQENPLHGRRILLVEDNEVNTLVARRLLEKQGCIVTAASNGQLAVDAFRTSPKGWYDAVLMDIRMPVMDGLEASRTIRLLTRADAKTVPIIAMTANAYASDVEAALAAGMNAHLAKPVDPALLYRTLAQFIRR